MDEESESDLVKVITEDLYTYYIYEKSINVDDARDVYCVPPKQSWVAFHPLQ